MRTPRVLTMARRWGGRVTGNTQVVRPQCCLFAFHGHRLRPLFAPTVIGRPRQHRWARVPHLCNRSCVTRWIGSHGSTRPYER